MIDYKSFLSSAMISDILDELGYERQLLPSEIKPNFIEARLFGRAKNLTLKQISYSEDYREVYDALFYIETFNPGDILVVGNGFRDLAFFGELMAILMKSKSAEGVIIDGFTRDVVETINLRYPVFARGNYARDIKKRGIVDKFDIPITIGDCIVSPGDLIFGDYDAVAIIPKNIENEVLHRCILVTNLEQKIKKDIKNGGSIEEILREQGDF